MICICSIMLYCLWQTVWSAWWDSMEYLWITVWFKFCILIADLWVLSMVPMLIGLGNSLTEWITECNFWSLFDEWKLRFFSLKKKSSLSYKIINYKFLNEFILWFRNLLSRPDISISTLEHLLWSRLSMELWMPNEAYLYEFFSRSSLEPSSGL